MQYDDYVHLLALFGQAEIVRGILGSWTRDILCP
jgi:hypothetical protein